MFERTAASRRNLGQWRCWPPDFHPRRQALDFGDIDPCEWLRNRSKRWSRQHRQRSVWRRRHYARRRRICRRRWHQPRWDGRRHRHWHRRRGSAGRLSQQRRNAPAGKHDTGREEDFFDHSVGVDGGRFFSSFTGARPSRRPRPRLQKLGGYAPIGNRWRISLPEMACRRARADRGMRASYEHPGSNGRVQGEPEIHLKPPITAERQRARKNFVGEIAGAVSSCHAFIEQAPPGECWELAFVAAGP